MGKPSHKLDLARDVCKRFPKAHTLTLAKKLCAEHPMVFMSVEDARGRIRYARGESGDMLRKHIGNKVIKSYKNQIPKSDAVEIEPVPFGLRGKGVVANDVHVPYHSVPAIDAMVTYAVQKGHTDWLYLNGDIVDCYQLSRFEKIPTAARFREELDKTNQLLNFFGGIFKNIWFKIGNHEARLETYLMRKAPEIWDAVDFSWETMLKLPERGITLVPSTHIVVAGKLVMIHGHEFGGGVQNPVNPARGLFLRGKTTALCGHHHQSSYHSEGTLLQHRMGTWSLGCLCELTPKYMPLAYTKWQHGFALLTYEGGDEFEIQNKVIEHGKVL